MAERPRPRLSTVTRDVLDDVMEENEYNTYDQAIRHVMREAGHDV